MEPAFSHDTPAWPPAGLDAMPREPDDPAIAFPRTALRPLVLTPANENLISGNLDAPVAPPERMERTRIAKAPESRRKWPAAIAASCFFHAAAVLVALVVSGIVMDPTDLTQVEGVDQNGEMVVGNAAEDQVSAGDITNVTLVPMVSARPVETITAEPVAPAEALQPTEQAAVETPATETLAPLEEQKAAPSTAEAAKPEQNILAVQPMQPDDNNVVEPLEAARAETVKPIEAPKAEAEAEPAKQVAARQPTQGPKKEEKPQIRKTADAPVKKTTRPARRKPAAGSGGANASDSRRGVAEGREQGQATLANRGAGSSGIGNAAVSNYPGKVAAKLRRAARNISPAARRAAHNNAQVSFVVNRDGDVASVRLVKTSGSPDLDKTAVAIIRRAAPFPPIPPEAQRATWAFTLPIGPF